MTKAFWVVVTVQMKKRQERHGQECQIRRLVFELCPVDTAQIGDRECYRRPRW